MKVSNLEHIFLYTNDNIRKTVKYIKQNKGSYIKIRDDPIEFCVGLKENDLGSILFC